MAIRKDIQSYVNDYRGVLGWSGYTELYSNQSIPPIEIPLYIKEHPIPIRKPKVTELNVAHNTSSGSYDTTTNLIFMGAPEILQVQIAGWTITPVSNSQWTPKDKNGNLLNFGCLSYNDIICYFIEGRFNRSKTGAWTRRDPDYYITPRGQYYTNPIIAIFQPQATVVMRKQAFEMTLYLET